MADGRSYHIHPEFLERYGIIFLEGPLTAVVSSVNSGVGLGGSTRRTPTTEAGLYPNLD